MIVAVVGSGGREAALCRKISESPKVDKVYAFPGNAGISKYAECVGIEDISGIAQFSSENNIDLIFIGPETPLAKGIVDTLLAKGIKVIGPDMKAATLESSKTWAKEFMNKYSIPTAKYSLVDKKSDLLNISSTFNFPLVVKIDGLCSGKGVFICKNKEDLIEASESIYTNVEKGSLIIVEEFLEGEEASFMFFTDGTSYIEIATSKDHKKIFDGDLGPNTGGMGAYSPAKISKKAYQTIIKDIVLPSIEGIKAENLNYKGILYVGLMINNDDTVKVLEYNVRLGDPETQVILPRMKSDIMDILIPLADGYLPKNYKVKWTKEYATCVVLAQAGYPGSYKKGVKIPFLKNYKEPKDVFLYHSGTVKKEDDEFYTNGGRVLGITALGKTLEASVYRAYKELELIKWEEAIYRTDIGKK